MEKHISVSLDVFSAIWSSRRPDEQCEDDVLRRVFKVGPRARHAGSEAGDAPRSKKWTDVIIWALEKHGGRATLREIYDMTRIGRERLGKPITAEHDASARECLDSHCSDSGKFRGKADLFYMPEGKGAGVWALRKEAVK